jgi:hypothetical protein
LSVEEEAPIHATLIIFAPNATRRRRREDARRRCHAG